MLKTKILWNDWKNITTALKKVSKDPETMKKFGFDEHSVKMFTDSQYCEFCGMIYTTNNAVNECTHCKDGRIRELENS